MKPRGIDLFSILINKEDKMVADGRARVAQPSESTNARPSHAIDHRAVTTGIDVTHRWVWSSLVVS